jgi:Fe-S-cluster-containing dehydrogenase component/formate-dependent nitrite reductase membrane component NrfD
VEVTQQAFVIDQGRCIGCHACTVACKVEHGVELGVFRTWVKYVERGEFPHTQRHFSVLRCNHCSNAPCVKVCPVTALYRREDGIVDFDPLRCIGCKACMNACPYDALYIDPDSHTAAKCNFCAHRVELDLKPSCEAVCPVGAIVSGDIDDADSPVSRLLAEHGHGDGHGHTHGYGGRVQVRSPEQGTRPNVYYLDAAPEALDPLAAAIAGAYLTTEVPRSQQQKFAPIDAAATPATVTSDIAHPPPWGWKVSSYFLTKGVAAGAMMLAALLARVTPDRNAAIAGAVPAGLALGGIALTAVLLVCDLERPSRFHYLLLHPQWGSWLARGAAVITGAAVLAGAFAAAVASGSDGLRDALAWPLIPTGAALAGYTAKLFGQCEGRHLWQSRLLLPHTVVNALLAGAGALAIAAAGDGVGVGVRDLLEYLLLGLTVASAGMIGSDVFGKHATRQAEHAARNLYRSRFAAEFWLGGIVIGLVLPAVLAAVARVTGGAVPLAAAGVAALAGLWLYEDAWVRAGQSVPLS